MTKPSKELSLTVKQGFKFLDALGLRLKDEGMMLSRESDKIYRSVILFDTIQVMNYPALRQCFVVRSLPDKYMLINITALVRPWVLWPITRGILAIGISPATSSTHPVFFCLLKGYPQLTRRPPIFYSTMPAPFAFMVVASWALVNWSTAINASVNDRYCIQTAANHFARSAPFCQIPTRLTTINTWVTVYFFPIIILFRCLQFAMEIVTLFTSLCLRRTHLTTANTYRSVQLFPASTFFFSPHSIILAHRVLDVNILERGLG